MQNTENQTLQPEHRLFIEAAVKLQEVNEVNYLARSLCKMFFAYLDQCEFQNDPSEVGNVGRDFNLILTYLLTIQENVHENCTDASNHFEGIVNNYHAEKDALNLILEKDEE